MQKSSVFLIAVGALVFGGSVARSAPLVKLNNILSWPQAPLGGKPLSYKLKRDAQETANIALEGPQAKLSKDDWVQVGKQSDAKGLLVYGNMFDASRSDDANQYIVFRGIGVEGAINGASSSSAFYHYNRFWAPWGVQLSKNGGTLVSRVGAVDRHEHFSLFRWHLSDGSSNLVGRGLVNSWNAFSDDGNFWACVQTASEDDSALARMPSDLFVNDTRKEYSSWLVTHLASGRQPVWNSTGKLFYTHEPPTTVLETVKSEGKAEVVGSKPTLIIDAPNKYPSIWIADPKTKTTHAVIERACDPSPSPDGNYIAFFGWPINEKPTAKKPASEAKLWLYQVATGKTFQANDQSSGYVGWTRDSKTLVLGRFEDQYKLHVGALALSDALQGAAHVASLKTEKAVVETSDDGLKSQRIWPPAIQIQDVSRNGKYLVVSTEHFLPATDPQGPLPDEHKMLAVDLSDGHISTIATAIPDPPQFFSWSWFDESDAP